MVGAKRRSHFFILIILLQRDFSSFENLIFFVLKNERGVRGEFHFSKHLILLPLTPHYSLLK